MGIELFGLAPQSQSGGYFGSSFFEWRPAVALMRVAAPGLVTEQKAIDLSFNDSSGVACPEACKTLSESITRHLERHRGRVLLAGDSVRPTGLGELLIRWEEPADWNLYDYEATPEMLSDLRRFLCKCGGFSVA